MSSYSKEATIRIAYLSAAAAAAAILGGVAAFLLSKLFPGTNHASHGHLSGWGGFAVFAAVCGFLVYKIDQKMNERFDKNP